VGTAAAAAVTLDHQLVEHVDRQSEKRPTNRQIWRAEQRLVTELGREPTGDEIAEATGLGREDVESIRTSAQTPLSLEMPLGDEEESELGRFIADERAESPYERAAEVLTSDALREALENLSYRERGAREFPRAHPRLRAR
jgi:RNA polymerase primary sigma factor